MEYKFENLAEETTLALSESESEVSEGEIATYASEGNVSHMIETLPLMGKGMLGIFIVTLLIVSSVVLLNKLTGNKENN